MSKPTLDDTRWAITGGGADATNLTAPASGEKDTGYVTNQIPTSGKLNWLFRKIHAWFIYLTTHFLNAQTRIYHAWAGKGSGDTTVAFTTANFGGSGGARTAIITLQDTSLSAHKNQFLMPLGGLPLGWVISAIRVRLDNQSGTSTDLTLVSTTTAGSVDEAHVTTAASGVQTVALGSLSVPIAADKAYDLVNWTNTFGGGTIKVNHFEVDVSPP